MKQYVVMTTAAERKARREARLLKEAKKVGNSQNGNADCLRVHL